MAKIKIYNGNTTSKKLELSDGGHTFEKKGRSIKWKIIDSEESKVASIEKIVVTSGAGIFEKLPAKDGKKWKAKLAKNASDNDTCKYSIFWNPKKPNEGEETLEHDPQISVKPTSVAKILLPIIAIAAACALYWLPKISNIRRK